MVISNSFGLPAACRSSNQIPFRFANARRKERVDAGAGEVEADGPDDVFVDGMILDIQDVSVERLAGAAGAEAVVADPGGQLAEVLVDGAGELTRLRRPH
jgi:hypothetical protein